VQERDELAAAYDAEGETDFGYQGRRCVLQLHQLAKDLRTDLETGNLEAVLHGDVQPFIGAYLRAQPGTRK